MLRLAKQAAYSGNKTLHRFYSLPFCDTCSIILQANQIATQSESELLSRYSPLVRVEEVAAGAPLQVLGENDIGTAYDVARAQLYTLAGTEACRLLPGVGVGRIVPEDALSESSLSLAGEWLDDCIASHDGCKLLQETYFPTRVIDVGVQDEMPYLLVSKGSQGQYATLSHCWGDYYPLTTTEATLSRRIDGIPLAELPKTFQDSIVVTRRLGIRYLWIDSLCIIQDSTKDWAEESAKMQQVYACAVINLSADAAANSSIGLSLADRLGGGQQVGLVDGLFCRPIAPGLDSCGSSHAAQEGSCQQILSSRAWVLQERLLSTRILHFSACAWECHTHTRCECTFQPRRPRTTDFAKLKSQTRATEFDPYSWAQLISTYSVLDLTFQSDKLNAIAGIAARAADCWSTTYIAGLWKEELPTCFL